MPATGKTCPAIRAITATDITSGCDADHVGMGFDANDTARYFFYRTSSRPSNTPCGG